MSKNNMRKRGQVTVFIIIGVVALIVISLILFLRNQTGLFVPKQEFLKGVSENIKDSISECIDTYAKDGLNLMYDQGGKINPTDYKLYQSKKVSYLCTNIPKDKRCLNLLQPLSSWEKELDDYLKLNLDQCINLDAFKSSLGAYDIKYEGYDINTQILEEEVLVEVKPKITITKDGKNLNVDSTFRNYQYPLGKVHSIVFDAVNAYAVSGDFYNLAYTLSMKGSYEIFIDDKPYPDIIYYVQKKDDDKKFYFAIEGE
ncbi:MAG: hypothetical protein Q8N88_05555 [Nanoarchaeota archaeon]|nr:hypothetical protein [Nanoarchaeota archaeon]